MCDTSQNKYNNPYISSFYTIGSGHYDGVIEKLQMILQSKSIKYVAVERMIKNETHCHEITFKYATVIRCECLKNKQSCTELCDCKNCNNSFGQRRLTDPPKRKRFKHEWQKYEKLSSIEYAHSKGEKIETGPFTILEYFVLENILTNCNEQEIDPISNFIMSIYGQIVNAMKLNPDLPISSKSVDQIEKFITMHDKRFPIFKNLCKNQLAWNASDENLN